MIQDRKCAMNVMIASQVEDDYLLITSSGSISNTEEYMPYAKRCHDEIMKHGITKVIVDELEMQYPAPSLLDVIDSTEFYSETFLPEMESLKLAVVAHSDIKPIAEFWEFQTNEADDEEWQIKFHEASASCRYGHTTRSCLFLTAIQICRTFCFASSVSPWVK